MSHQRGTETAVISLKRIRSSSLGARAYYTYIASLPTLHIKCLGSFHERNLTLIALGQAGYAEAMPLPLEYNDAVILPPRLGEPPLHDGRLNLSLLPRRIQHSRTMLLK